VSGELGVLEGLRVGFGMSAQQHKPDEPLRLAGLELQGGSAASGATDGDVISRAVVDAMLSACGLPEIGALLDPVEMAASSCDSYMLLSQLVGALRRKRLRALLNLSIKLLMADPLGPTERARMVGLLASALDVLPGQVSLSCGTDDGLLGAPDRPQCAALAYALCVIATPGKSVKVPAAPYSAAQAAARNSGAARDEDSLAGRPRDFETAVRSKLPPLPPAPPPRSGDTLIVYADGASRGNPGPAATGWLVLDAQGQLVGEGGTTLGERTNNEAEYEAVLEVARWIESTLGRDFHLLIRSDSELLIHQLRGEWKVKDPELRQLAMRAMNTLLFFTTFELSHVPRAENSRADALANRALDEAGKQQKA
jgi:ribonuclease HI